MEASSEQVANLVSMPHLELEQLLDVGAIPSRRVDGQRIVKLADVIAHKNREDTLRLMAPTSCLPGTTAPASTSDV